MILLMEPFSKWRKPPEGVLWRVATFYITFEKQLWICSKSSSLVKTEQEQWGPVTLAWQFYFGVIQLRLSNNSVRRTRQAFLVKWSLNRDSSVLSLPEKLSPIPVVETWSQTPSLEEKRWCQWVSWVTEVRWILRLGSLIAWYRCACFGELPVIPNWKFTWSLYSAEL